MANVMKNIINEKAFQIEEKETIFSKNKDFQSLTDDQKKLYMLIMSMMAEAEFCNNA